MRRIDQDDTDSRWDPDLEEDSFEKMQRRHRAPLPVSSERTARAAKETNASKKARRSVSQSGGFHKRRRRKIR